MDIRSDRQKGLSYAEISRKYHIDPRTAKKYAHSETRPVYKLTGPKSSKLDPYKERILHWLEEAPYSAMRIFGSATLNWTTFIRSCKTLEKRLESVA